MTIETDKKVLTIKDIDYIEPNYMIQFVTRFLRMYKKGVFMIRTNSGMGKSTFAAAMDQWDRQFKNEALSHVSVAAIHLDEYFVCESDVFVQQMSEKLGQLIDHTKHITIPEYQLDNEAVWLAQMLESIKKEMKYQQKLLLIIDGLDKIPLEYMTKNVMKSSILDFIPWAEIMSEHVYVLILQQVPRDISLEKQQAMLQFEGIKRLLGNREFNSDRIADYYYYNESYRDTLKTYIKQKNPNEQLAQHIIELSKAHFESVVLLELLLRRFNAEVEELRAITTTEGYLRLLYKKIELKYDAQYVLICKQIMCILATAFRKLTLSELEVLFGTLSATTHLLITALNDLRCLFVVEKRRKDSIEISITSDKMRSALLAIHYSEIKHIIRREWLKQCIQSEIDDITYLFEYMMHYIVQYDQDGINEGQYSKDIGVLYMQYIEQLERKNPKLFDRKRIKYQISNCYLGLFKYIYSLHKKNQLQDYIHVSKISHRAIWEMKERHKNKEALWVADNTVEIIEKLNHEGKLHNAHELASAYKNLGVALYRNNQYSEATEEYKKAIAYRLQLKTAGKPGNESALASAYMNLGIALSKENKVDEAIEAYLTVIDIREKIGHKSTYHNENDLAAAYMNLAISYDLSNQIEAAIRAYRRSITIREDLRLREVLVDENQLAVGYSNLGMALYGQHHRYEAVLEFKKAISLMEYLQRQKRLKDENGLATVYANIGVAYKSLHKMKDAIEHFQRAITHMEFLQSVGKLSNENDLMNTLINLSNIFKTENRLEDAHQNYHKTIKIGEELLEADKLENINDLAITYLQRAYSNLNKTFMRSAILDSNRSVHLFIQLLTRQSTQINAIMILQAMYVTASCAKELECLDIYIKDLEQCQKLFQQVIDITKLGQKPTELWNEINKIIG